MAAPGRDASVDLRLIAVSDDEPTEWEPFPFTDVLEGDPAGRVHWLRQRSGGDGVLLAGIFTGEPSRFLYEFAGDETFHCLAGRVTITVEGASSVEVTPGTIVSFPKGARSQWHIHEPVKKFFVVSG